MPPASSSPSIIFAGGGTGGHIFPALAIAEELVKFIPTARCTFLVSQRPLDAEILSKQSLAGAPIAFTAIPAQPFGLSPRTFIRFLSNWSLSLRTSREFLRAQRASNPQVLVAMGGFVAAPAAQAARVEKTPTLLINLDAVPGRANTWIATRATRVLTSAPVANSSWTTIPPIVRTGALATSPQADCRRSLNLDPNLPTLLITGGSQGASSLNQFLIALANANALTGWQVIHQTGGGRDEDATRDAYTRAHIPALVRPFFDHMAPCWGAADLAICRAGAGNVGEVWASKVPSIFMPYPYHKDQHQKYNAQPLVRAGGALLCTDHIAPASNMSSHQSLIADLLASAPKRDAMRQALHALGPANGAARAAAAIAEMLATTK